MHLKGPREVSLLGRYAWEMIARSAFLQRELAECFLIAGNTFTREFKNAQNTAIDVRDVKD